MKRIIHAIRPWIPIILICCLAAYLRLYKISEYMTFLGDEGRDVLVVKRMIVDGKFTLLGPTASVGGFFMGPIYYYFMAPFLWAWKLNPVGPAIMVALFGIATVYLTYLAGSRWFSKRVGIIASALYAVSPIVISFSRSSWNPNIVPFFALFSLLMLERARREKNFRLLFWVGLCAGVGIQLHYTYLFLIVMQVLFAVYSYKMIKMRDIGLGLVGLVIGFSPFLAFELRHGFMNTQAIIAFIFAGKDTGFSAMHFLTNTKDVPLRLFGRFLLRIPEAGALGNIVEPTRTLWIVGEALLAAGGLFALATRFTEAAKAKSQQKKGIAVLLLLWFLVPLFFFGVYKKNVYDYYFGMMFPLPFLLTAALISDVWNIKIIGRVVGFCSAVALLLFNWQGRPFVYEPNNQLGQVETISKEVISHTDGKPFNFALITTGNSDHAYRYFFEIWNKKPTTIENRDVDPEQKTVTDQLLIVCEDIFCQPLGNSLWEVAGFGRAEIAGVWDVSVVKIYKLVHYKENTL